MIYDSNGIARPILHAGAYEQWKEAFKSATPGDYEVYQRPIQLCSATGLIRREHSDEIGEDNMPFHKVGLLTSPEAQCLDAIRDYVPAITAYRAALAEERRLRIRIQRIIINQHVCHGVTSGRQSF
jgi:hypothetical protein